jgi:hypothetical protein
MSDFYSSRSIGFVVDEPIKAHSNSSRRIGFVIDEEPAVKAVAPHPVPNYGLAYNVGGYRAVARKPQ